MDKRLDMKKLKEATAAANHQRSLEGSKNRLKALIHKKFTTTMIGNLAKFEKYFGHLWGHGKPKSVLTNMEKQNRDIWELIRTEILNDGHLNLRSIIEEELSQYNVEWLRYSKKFEIVTGTSGIKFLKEKEDE